MQLALILNELSYDRWSPENHSAVLAIKAMAGLLKDIRALRRDAFVLSSVKLSDLVFGDGQHLRMYAGVRDTKEEVLSIFSFANRSPFSVLGIDGVDCECLFQERSAIGLLYSAITPGISVSFFSDQTWDTPFLDVTLRRMVEDENGDPRIIESVESIPHISGVAHIPHHKALIEVLGVELVVDGRQLWSRRAELFPNIRFLPRVQGQLESLADGSDASRQISVKLNDLQRATAEWDVDAAHFPAWRSYVTSESSTRKNLTRFEDESGLPHLYETHARYTPGAGRIYFRVIREERRIEVAHVGMKL